MIQTSGSKDSSLATGGKTLKDRGGKMGGSHQGGKRDRKKVFQQGFKKAADQEEQWRNIAP